VLDILKIKSRLIKDVLIGNNTRR